MAERGLQVLDKAPPSQTRVVTDKDGQITDMVPHGIDPGWDHNVGKSWIASEVALGEKLARLPMWLRGEFSQKTVTPEFQRVIEANFKGFQKRFHEDLIPTRKRVGDGFQMVLTPVPRGNLQVLGYMDKHLVDALAEKVPHFELTSTLLMHRDDTQFHIEGRHKAVNNPKQVWPEEFRNALPTHLHNYRAIFWDVDKRTLLFVPQGSFNDTIPFGSFEQTSKGYWLLRGLGSKDAATFRSTKKYLPLAGKV